MVEQGVALGAQAGRKPVRIPHADQIGRDAAVALRERLNDVAREKV
jgi:hypothetical protein